MAANQLARRSVPSARIGWVEPFAKPISGVWNMMGIASAFALRATADVSLHPSLYGVWVVKRRCEIGGGIPDHPPAPIDHHKSGGDGVWSGIARTGDE